MEKLNGKFPFEEVDKNIDKELPSGLPEDKKAGRINNRKTSLNEAKKTLKKIASDFSETDASFFRDNFMDQVLTYYRAEKGKIKGLKKIKELRSKTIDFFKDVAAKRGFDEKDVRIMEDYFRSIFSIEFLVNNLK